MRKTLTLTPRQLADRLDRLAAADRHNPGGGDAQVLEWAARGLRMVDDAYRQQHQLAERLAAELSTARTTIAALRAELIEQRANVAALEAVASRPAPYATEQHIESDTRGNIVKVTTRPVPAQRPAGFS
jgi:hypothetical protein